MWTRSLGPSILVCAAALGCGNRTDVGASPAGTSGDDGAPSDATATEADTTSDATAIDAGTMPDATSTGACGDDAGVRTSDAACPTIRVADYDQSCTADSDCVEVGEGNACDLGCGFSCGGHAINRCALARYEADVAAARRRADLDAAFTVDPSSGYPNCNCPEDSFVCCRAGQCVDDRCCHNACPDAGDVGLGSRARVWGGG